MKPTQEKRKKREGEKKEKVYHEGGFGNFKFEVFVKANLATFNHKIKKRAAAAKSREKPRSHGGTSYVDTYEGIVQSMEEKVNGDNLKSGKIAFHWPYCPKS